MKLYTLFVLLLGYCVAGKATAQHDKWIVVTTIQYPTVALKKFAKIPGWRLVVVADKKTPTDWHLDNCDFLSVERQQQLPYKLIKHLPWNHYSRKNIGYLYAIEHGATIIYESDDDNFLIADAITALPETEAVLHYHFQDKARVTAVNPYAHFGHPTVWPRGYPLRQVKDAPVYHLAYQESSIPIQQGLVNNDPDVDAIFRLTRSPEITFNDRQQPIALPEHVMCPFNSQNTLFYAKAFWGLYMPMTPSFRVCDIWRGYWVQRMLWDIGSKLCFLPPTAIQYRNEHDLLKDFADEYDLYLKADNLIQELNRWSSAQPLLSDRMVELLQHLTHKGFFKHQELEAFMAWVEDLKAVGYLMPAVQETVHAHVLERVSAQKTT